MGSSARTMRKNKQKVGFKLNEAAWLPPLVRAHGLPSPCTVPPREGPELRNPATWGLL